MYKEILLKRLSIQFQNMELTWTGESIHNN